MSHESSALAVLFGFIVKTIALAQCDTPSDLLFPPVEGASFGNSLATDGDRLIVGGPKFLGETCGSAFVYRIEGVELVFEQELIPWSTDCEDFGDLAQVDISGDVAVVSAQFPHSQFWKYGQVFVYRHDGSNWTQEQILMSSYLGTPDLDEAVPVAVDGDTIVLGEWWALNWSAEVFRFDGSEWKLEQQLNPSDATSYNVGWSVALDGDRVILSAYDDGEWPWATGAAWIFRREGSEWTEEQKLVHSDPALTNYFGWGLALQGDTAVVNAPGDANASGQLWYGAAYVFQFDGAQWNEVQKLEPNGEDQFSLSVAVDEELIIAGRHLFAFDGASWNLAEELSPTNGAFVGDFFDPVALSPSLAVIGKPGGTVHAFDISCLRPACEGDANGDGLIDPLDAGFVISRFGCAVGTGDAECDVSDQNLDGQVDPLDSGYVLARFGECP